MNESKQIEVRSKLKKAIEYVDSQLAKMEDIKHSSYQTNGDFKWTPTSATVSCHIHRSVDMHELISIHSSLYSKKRDYDASAKLLRVETFPSYMWQNVPVEKWLLDIALRIKIIYKAEVEKDLLKKKNILEKHLSEDDRLERTLLELGF